MAQLCILQRATPSGSVGRPPGFPRQRRREAGTGRDCPTEGAYKAADTGSGWEEHLQEKQNLFPAFRQKGETCLHFLLLNCFSSK